MAYGAPMVLALFVTLWGGGDDAGPGGGLIAVLLAIGLVAVPGAVGLALRRRDRRRGVDPEEEPRTPDPPPSGAFDASWGRGGGSDPWRRSTRRDWTAVGAFAAALVLLWILTQL